MSTSLKTLLASANAEIKKLSFEDAQTMIAKQNALVVDVRDGTEVETGGKVKNAVNVSRGMLEFRADPESPYHNAEFQKDRPVLLYCASGGRSALAAKTLKDLGYEKVYNLGSFKEWADQGGEIEK